MAHSALNSITTKIDKKIPLKPILSMTELPQSNLSTFLISVFEQLLEKFLVHSSNSTLSLYMKKHLKKKSIGTY